MYCDSSITIVWGANVFINDFPLPESKKIVLSSKQSPTCVSPRVSTFI